MLGNWMGDEWIECPLGPKTVTTTRIPGVLTVQGQYNARDDYSQKYTWKRTGCEIEARISG